jgi:broad specificity phosphatase PhoE
MIRHAQSEGNVDETMYQRKPDHRLELTERGIAEARAGGQQLKDLLGPNESVYVYVSPYLR